MKTVTTYTKDLLTLSVGEVIKVPMRKYVGYTTTASLLKKDGKGSWTSHKIDKKYFTMLRQS